MTDHQPPEAADLRKEQMLRAALEVISERGFAETRIADVAERTGSSPALVIYYFGTKDSLLTEAMRYAEDVWYETGALRTAKMDSAWERLGEIVAMTCAPRTGEDLPDSWTLWLDLWAQAARKPKVAAVREEFDRHWRNTIAEIVRHGQERGEFAAVDATEFSVIFSALLDGLAVQVALDDPEITSARALEVSMRFAAGQLGFDRPDQPIATVQRAPDAGRP